MTRPARKPWTKEIIGPSNWYKNRKREKKSSIHKICVKYTDGYRQMFVWEYIYRRRGVIYLAKRITCTERTYQLWPAQLESCGPTTLGPSNCDVGMAKRITRFACPMKLVAVDIQHVGIVWIVRLGSLDIFLWLLSCSTFKQGLRYLLCLLNSFLTDESFPCRFFFFNDLNWSLDWNLFLFSCSPFLLVLSGLNGPTQLAVATARQFGVLKNP